jgi:hypothetical protein
MPHLRGKTKMRPARFKKNRFERELAKHVSLKKFEKGCIVAKKGAIGPIFEGDIPP